MIRYSEGGNAIGGQKIPKDRVEPTFSRFNANILSHIPHSKVGLIGSSGKKPFNGDIDLGIATSLSLEEISSILTDLGVRHVVNKGLNEINTEFFQILPNGEETNIPVQVDLMVGPSFDWLNFVYCGYSPEETKYKPLTRTAAIYALLSFGAGEELEDGSRVFYSLSPARGIFKKKGAMVKTKKGSLEFKSEKIDDVYINQPQKVADILSAGALQPWSVNELKMPFEDIWSRILERYPQAQIEKMAGYIRDFCVSQKLDIPAELEEFLKREIIAESLEDLYRAGMTSLPGDIVDVTSTEMAPLDKPGVNILTSDDAPSSTSLFPGPAEYTRLGTYAKRRPFGEAKTSHLTHLEDLLYDEGNAGGERIFTYLDNIFDTLKGNTPATELKTTVKIDGCFAPSTLIKTSAGDKSIFEVIQSYKNKENIKVASKNLDSHEIEFVSIEGASIESGEKNWVRLTLEDNTEIFCTEDHPILTINRGYVPAKELTSEDDIDYVEDR